MSEKVYLVKLADHDNDIMVKVVDQETWDWINLNDNGQVGKNSHYEDSLCPDSVKEKIKQFQEMDHNSFEERGIFAPSPTPFKFCGVFLSIGSWNNDRAILSPPLNCDPEFRDVGNTTKHTLDLLKRLESLGYELDLENEYNGLIY